MRISISPFFSLWGIIKSFLSPHIHHSTNAVTLLHLVEGIVDTSQGLAVGDELVDLELTIEVVIYQARELRATLDTAEGAASPYTTRHELEWSCGDLLSGSSNTNDDALTPALVAGFQSGTHDAHITGAVESVVAATVGHFDELLLDGLAGELGGVDEVSGTELAGPWLLAVVDIYDDYLAGLVLHGTLDDGQTDAASTKDGNVGALLDLGCYNGCTVASGDTAAQQAGLICRGLGSNSHDGDIGNHSVLREGRSAHEVQDILAAGLKTRGAVGHHTPTLSGSNLAAKVGLSRYAELALLALGGIEGNDVISRLNIGHTLTYRFDDASTFVTENDGEGSFGILSGKSVRVCVANAGMVNLDTDFMSLGGCDLDIFDGERLAGTPGDRSFASDGLSDSAGHDAYCI